MLKQKKGPAFLLKTFDMLQVSHGFMYKKQQFKQIIDWTAEGTGFVVKNPTQLSQKVLPKYFKHSNMHSFIRQLNMYGFNKKRGSKVQNYYFHPLFKKGDRQGISQMQRKAQKKCVSRESLREGGTEQVSIELQQNSQSLNKVSNKKLISEMNIQNQKKQTQLDDNKTLKNSIELNSMNKILILEQIYHLANISANNLLTYHLNQENQGEIIEEQREIKEYKQIIEKFTKTKDEYVKVMSMIWDKVNAQVQKYELSMQNMQKNQSLNEMNNDRNTHNINERQQKFLKQTQISIQKLPSKLLSYNQSIEPPKTNQAIIIPTINQKLKSQNENIQPCNIEIK